MIFGIPTVYIWLALTIVFVIIEVATTDISSIWLRQGLLFQRLLHGWHPRRLQCRRLLLQL